MSALRSTGAYVRPLLFLARSPWTALRFAGVYAVLSEKKSERRQWLIKLSTGGGDRVPIARAICRRDYFITGLYTEAVLCKGQVSGSGGAAEK